MKPGLHIAKALRVEDRCRACSNTAEIPVGRISFATYPKQSCWGTQCPPRLAGAAGQRWQLAHLPQRAHWEDCLSGAPASPVAAGHSVPLPCPQNQPFSIVSSSTTSRTSMFAGSPLSPHPRPLLPYLANECWEKKQASPSAVNGKRALNCQ